MNKARLFYLAPVAFMFFSCATQVAPTGGAKDTIPPAVVRQVPDSFSTHFNSKNIAITFDEYIHLENLNEQLVISPPLAAMPDIKVKNKTLLIHLDDTLKENKTYTFNFGSAIKDIAENNALENFQYVFSTGAAVDTEHISGKVLNAFTMEPEKGVLVMLYEQQTDSLPYLDKPSYFSRTKADGRFVIKNISQGNYKIFALKETNNNYLFDSKDESIAFIDSAVSSGSDSVKMHLFTETLPQRLVRANAVEPGKVTFIFQQPIDSLRYDLMSGNPEIFATEYSAGRDTVLLWYKNVSADTLALKIISPLLSSGDTVIVPLVNSEKVKAKEKDALRGRGAIAFQLSVQTNLSGKFDLNDTIRIVFSHPIASWDSTQIMLMEDSVKRASCTIKFTDVLKRNLFIATQWKENTGYKLKIPPGVFTDVFGFKNDTLEFTFQTRQLNEYGTMKLDVNVEDSLGNNVNMILHLLDEKGNVVRRNYLNKSRAVYYEYLIPAIYHLRLIMDKNGNGKWDTGNYLRKEQPEKIIYHQQKINVRANWDIEMEWNISHESK
jgi:hypothetical protein